MKRKSCLILLSIAVCVTVLMIGIATTSKGKTFFDPILKSGKQGTLVTRIKNFSSREFQKLMDSTLYANIESDAWLVESKPDREKLPLYKYIKPASGKELTNSSQKFDSSSSWYRSNGNSSSNHFSSLKQINRDNVSKLEMIWIYRAGTGAKNVQANPVMAKGLLFITTGGDNVEAINAVTGTKVWRFDPGYKSPAERGFLWVGGNKKNSDSIYFAAGNRLFSLNSETGSLNKRFGGGSINIGHTSKVAPALFHETIIIASTKPALHAYNITNGMPLWTVDLKAKFLPKAPGGRPSREAGGNPWGGISLDEERGIAYLTTGNPGPVLVGVDRPGRNPYSSSVVAIDVKKGAILWDFQEVSHDLWDLDIAAPPLLTTIERNGVRKDVVVAVTKAGNTLLLDRVTGKPIYEYRLRRAPTSMLPGERTAPYQPDLIYPEPFSKQEFTTDDVTNISAKNRQYVLDQIENKNYGFFVPHEQGVESVFFGLHGGAEWPGAASNPQTGVLFVASNHDPSMTTVINIASSAKYGEEALTPGRNIYLDRCAGCHGIEREGAIAPALSWLNLRHTNNSLVNTIINGQQAMPPVSGISDKGLSLLSEYLLKVDRNTAKKMENSKRNGDFKFVKTKYRKLNDHEGYPGSKPPWGTLNAINLNTGKILWRVPLGEYKELTKRGIPQTGTFNFSGPIATAGGLIFASGTKDKMIRAFDSETGKELWEFELPFIGSAVPTTYMIDGRQYLVVPATGGGTLKLYDENVEVGDTFVAFALPENY